MYVSKVYEMPVDSYGDVRTLVRGLPYQCPDDWEEVLDSLDEDSNLYLIKEPDNPKDKLAIAAYLDDRRVGYVAASDNGKIWLYMTDEKMPCTFVERFEASFKISFENPRSQFEGMSFEDIYRDKDGVTEEPYAGFEIPFLTNPKDKDYDWYDDRTYIMDLEKFIPDFRRKLAARLIILAGRKNSEGEYCYYLPYSNNPIADIDDNTIKGLIDEHGFVIALPDVPMKTERGGIIMDLHVTYLAGITFWTFDSMHQSEFVFHLTQETVKQPKTKVKKSAWRNQSVKDSEPPTKNIEQVNSEDDDKPHEKVNHDEKDKIQEAVFQHCIFDVLGVKLKDTPNSKWKYESWNVFGGTYETYVFSAQDGNKEKCKKCEAIVNRNRNTNYEFKGLNADTVLSLLYHYRRVFDSSYQFEQCKEEYFKILDAPIGSISIETTPWLYIRRSDGYNIGDSKKAKYDVLLYTSLYNKEYIDELISQRKLITIF